MVTAEFIANPRQRFSRKAAEAALPMLAFASPLAFLLLMQHWTFGSNLFLGWDSSVYAWWATQIQENGAVTMILQWSNPNLYGLMVSGLGSAIGSVRLAEQTLPFFISLPLGYSCYALTSRVSGDRRLGILAAFFAGISIATIFMIANIQRNLLALGIAWIVGASIHHDLIATSATWRTVRKKALTLWFPLLLVVLATHVETYAVLLVALLVASVSTRRAVFLRTSILVVAPLVVLGPILIGYFLRFTSETSTFLPQGRFDVLSWAWIYLSGFAIPLIAIGILPLVRAARHRNATARYLVTWLLSLVVLVPPAILLHVPTARLLFMIPAPVLLALALPELTTRLRSWLETLRSRWARINQPAESVHDDRTSRSPQTSPPWPSIGALAVFLILVAPLVATTAMTKDDVLQPFIADADAVQLSRAGELVRQDGYREAIIVFYGVNAAYYAPIYRAYFGLEVPNNLAYYGKLQFVFTLPEPDRVYSWLYNPTTEANYATNYRTEILSTRGLSGIRTLPIVVAGGGIYTTPLSESFLGPFEREPGIYIIPPGSLTDREMDTWRLYASSDCFVCLQGASKPATWSLSPSVLEYIDLSNLPSFEAVYALMLVRGWATANLTIRFWDFPDTLPSPTGGNVTLAPLEVSIDGSRVLNHRYSGSGVISLTVPTGPLSAGLHYVVVKSSSTSLGVAVQLDRIELTPLT